MTEWYKAHTMSYMLEWFDSSAFITTAQQTNRKNRR